MSNKFFNGAYFGGDFFSTSLLSATLDSTLDDVTLAATATNSTPQPIVVAATGGSGKVRKRSVVPRLPLNATTPYLSNLPEKRTPPRLFGELRVTLEDATLFASAALAEAPSARRRRHTISVMLMD